MLQYYNEAQSIPLSISLVSFDKFILHQEQIF